MSLDLLSRYNSDERPLDILPRLKSEKDVSAIFKKESSVCDAALDIYYHIELTAFS